jgi:hypothetical protein
VLLLPPLPKLLTPCISLPLLSADALASQENYFFDGPARELNSKRVVLRLRFYDTDKKAVLTLKVRWLQHARPGTVVSAARPCLPAHARGAGCRRACALCCKSGLGCRLLAAHTNDASLTLGSGWDGRRRGGAWGIFIVTHTPSLTRVFKCKHTTRSSLTHSLTHQ